jgi:hypothetical protein
MTPPPPRSVLIEFLLDRAHRGAVAHLKVRRARSHLY